MTKAQYLNLLKKQNSLDKILNYLIENKPSLPCSIPAIYIDNFDVLKEQLGALGFNLVCEERCKNNLRYKKYFLE